jgi:uncharacterized protein YjbI with pentapeptide repeats
MFNEEAAAAAEAGVRGGDEAEVRATAQKILKAHLQPDDGKRFWPGIRLDLHGARLEDFSLYDCEVSDVDFRNAEFVGKAEFAAVDFKGSVEFTGAIFRGPATFGAAKFKEYADFDKTEFCDRGEFENARFDGADFYDSTFRKEFVAIKVKVDGQLNFRDSEFFGPAYFRGAQFGTAAVLDNCVFHDFVQFMHAKAQKVKMNAARLEAYVDFGEDLDFDLARATIKKDAAEQIFPPGDWYLC